MKKLMLAMVVLSMFVGVGIVRAEKCDSMFGGLEFYYCKEGKKEVQQGLDKTTFNMCLEYKKITPSDGCTFSKPFNTKEDHALIYIIGKIAQKEAWYKNIKFQCDKMGSYVDGGILPVQDTESYDYLPSEYYTGKMDLNERGSKFRADLEKQGKVVFTMIEIGEPSNEFLRYKEQVCQFWNKNSDTVAAKFSVNVYPPTGSAGEATTKDVPMVGEKKPADIAKPDAKGSVKKLFGK